MTIRRLGNDIVQQQTSVESNNLIASSTQEPPADSVQPAVMNETEKASRFQETGVQGLAMRSFLDSALPVQKDIWDDDLNMDLNAPNPMAVAADAAATTLSAMSNEELLQLAETPGGEQTLAAFAKTIKDGGDVTGLNIDVVPAEKSAEYQASYLRAVRRTMMESPSFAKNMNEINNGTPPVKILLGRNLPNRLDSFNEGKQQILDLSDLEKIPATPPLIHPESTTQGQVLSHAMREAQEAAKQQLHGQPDVDAAHKAAVKAENEYRADIGQKTMRLTEKDETFIETPPLGSTLLIHYDDGHSDGLLFDQNGNLTTINGNIFIPF